MRRKNVFLLVIALLIAASVAVGILLTQRSAEKKVLTVPRIEKEEFATQLGQDNISAVLYDIQGQLLYGVYATGKKTLADLPARADFCVEIDTKEFWKTGRSLMETVPSFRDQAQYLAIGLTNEGGRPFEENGYWVFSLIMIFLGLLFFALLIWHRATTVRKLRKEKHAVNAAKTEKRDHEENKTE